MRLQAWLVYPKLPDPSSVISLGFGLVFGLFLMIMRMRFIWWPFHPAGYAVASSYGMRENVSSLFFSWLIKICVLKYGGLRLHKRAIPLFLGLILGEFAIGGAWAMIGVVFGIQTYDFTSWY